MLFFVFISQVTLASPPLSLELTNPLTKQLTTTGDSNLALPLPNPLTTVLKSPPVEMLLSPQYYPKQTAK